MRMTGAKAMIECLQREGITHVFGVPGEQVLGVVDAVYDSDSIQFVSNRHEGGAAFMAEAFGKMTRKPAVCIGTAGVGASNMTLGIHTAMQDSTPMLAIIGQVNSSYRGREAWQEIDLASFYGHISKWAVEITDVSRIPEVVRKAVYTSLSGRNGPVVISVPEDILSDEFDFDYFTLNALLKPGMSDTDAENVITLLNQASKPVIFAGGGIHYSDAREELERFSDAAGIPVMTAFRRHDVFSNDHSNYLGNIGLGTFPEVAVTLHDADLIFAIGTRLSEISTQRYAFPRKDQKLIHVDIDEQILVSQPFQVDLAILSDAKKALQRLLEHLSVSQPHIHHHAWAAERKQRFTAALQTRKQERADLELPGISLESVVDSLKELLPPNAVITSDAGNFFTWFANYYSFGSDQRYLGPTSGAMGYGLPSAIAAKMASPERVAVALAGDGGFMMTMQEFETAVRYQIPVIAIVINNHSYGAIRLHQDKRFPDRIIGTKLSNPPFDQLAELFNGSGYRVTDVNQFRIALSEALIQNKPTIIEIQLDPRIISASKILEEAYPEHSTKK